MTDDRTKVGKKSGITGIICNIFLCVSKLIIGTISNSVSITADAVNNLSDAAGSIVTLIGFSLANKPADDEHPYGHQRIEYFSGLVVAMLILVIGYELAKSSVIKILHPEPVEFSIAIVIVLLLSIVVKLWMAWYYNKLGKQIGSQTLIANAADSRNDVITTSAVLIAAIVGELTGLMIDGYIGLLVALFIIISGIGIAKDTISPLLGEAPDEELVHEVAALMNQREEVIGIHDLIIHDYGPGRRYASAHAEMDSKLDVMISHEILDDIEREAKETLGVELTIHFDPVIVGDEETDQTKAKVKEILKNINPNISIHDFRMVKGGNHSNVIFDMVIPREYGEKTAELKSAVEEGLSVDGKTFYAVIEFDPEAFNDRHTISDKA